MDSGRTSLATMAILAAMSERVPYDVGDVKRQFPAGRPFKKPHVGRAARRNDRCPCGSGKKYKRCCMRKPT